MQLLSSRLTFDFLCCNRILSLRSIDIVGIGSASWVKFVTGLLATPYPASLTIEPNPFRILIRIAHIIWIFIWLKIDSLYIVSYGMQGQKQLHVCNFITIVLWSKISKCSRNWDEFSTNVPVCSSIYSKMKWNATSNILGLHCSGHQNTTAHRLQPIQSRFKLVITITINIRAAPSLHLCCLTMHWLQTPIIIIFILQSLQRLGFFVQRTLKTQGNVINCTAAIKT